MMIINSIEYPKMFHSLAEELALLRTKLSKDVYHKDISEKERKKLDDRRDWILEQIDGNLFDTRDLIYFKNTRLKSSDRSHADILADRIAEKKSKSKEQDQSIPENNQKLLEKIVELRWKRNKTNQDKKYLEKLLEARKERKLSLAFQMPIILKFLLEKS